MQVDCRHAKGETCAEDFALVMPSALSWATPETTPQFFHETRAFEAMAGSSAAGEPLVAPGL